MAEVILFRPRERYSALLGSSMMPLGLVFVATPLVAEGISVKIIDTETCLDWETELLRHVDSSTICAGIGVMTGFQIRGALDFSAKIKSIKNIPVIWGGLHPSFLPEQTLQHPLVDMVVMGEGEEKFRNIVHHLRQKKPLFDVAGIGYKNGTTPVFTAPEASYVDLSALPFPAYDLINMDYYVSRRSDFMGERKRLINLSSHRGCPNRCAFCYNLEFNKRTWRPMSPAKMLADIAEAKSRYNVDAVNFVSDNFFVNQSRVREFCQGLIDKNMDIVWQSDMRIDTFLRFDHELLTLIKRSGCTSITFGVESGSNRILDLIHKDIHAEDVLKAHDKIRQYGFKVHYHFMMGFPDETIRDVRQTMSLISKLVHKRGAYIHGPSMYVPYPGTPLFTRSVELGFKPPQSLEEWVDYDWSRKSKLPFFSGDYQSFLKEAHYFTAAVHAYPQKGNPLSALFYWYRWLRMAGLIRGIRLYNLDVNAIGFLKRMMKKTMQEK